MFDHAVTRPSVDIPRTRMQAGPLSSRAHRFLARRSDGRVVDRLRRIAEGAVALLHSENHDPRTNGEFRVVDLLAPWLRVVIDVGANRGNWTAHVLERCPQAHVYCFEVASPTRAALRSRFTDRSNVRVLEGGLFDRSEHVAVKHYPRRDGLTSLFDYPHPVPAMVLQEPVQRGDDIMEAQGVSHVDLLKVDAEGADLAVLRGFERMLRRASITAVQFEYGFACILARAFLLDFYELLGRYGYAVGKVRMTHVEFEPYRLESENFFGPNFLAVHHSEPRLIELLAGPPGRLRRGGSWSR